MEQQNSGIRFKLSTVYCDTHFIAESAIAMADSSKTIFVAIIKATPSHTLVSGHRLGDKSMRAGG